MTKIFDDKKFKFYLKYLVLPNKLKEFKQRLISTNLALQINPELAQEAKEQLIKDYPFVEEFFWVSIAIIYWLCRNIKL